MLTSSSKSSGGSSTSPPSSSASKPPSSSSTNPPSSSSRNGNAGGSTLLPRKSVSETSSAANHHPLAARSSLSTSSAPSNSAPLPPANTGDHYFFGGEPLIKSSTPITLESLSKTTPKRGPQTGSSNNNTSTSSAASTRSGGSKKSRASAAAAAAAALNQQAHQQPVALAPRIMVPTSTTTTRMMPPPSMGHNGNRVVLNTANTASATASITSMASSSSSTHRRVSSSNNLYLPHSYPQQTIFFNSSSSTATTSATAGKTSQHYDFSTSTTATNNYLLAKAISAPCSPSRTSVLSSRYSRQLIMPPSQYLQNKRPSMIAQQRAEREKSLPPLSDIRANLSYHADAAITLVGMSSAMIDNSWGAPDVVSRVFSNVLPTFEAPKSKLSQAMMPLIIENGVVGYGGGSSCKKRRFSESMEDSQQQNQHQQQVRSGKVSKPRLVGIGCTGGAEFSVPAKLAVFPLSTAVPTTLKPTAASCTDLPMDAERSSPGICDAMGHDNLYVSTIVGNAISSSYSSSSNSAPSNLRHRSNSPITESTSFDQVLSRLTNRPSGSNNILSSRLRNSIENLSGSSSSDVLCASPTKLEETGSNNGFADVKGGLVLGGVSATSMDIQPQQQQQTTSAGSATRSSNRTQRRLTTATIVSRCSSLESLHRPSAAAVPPRPRPSYHHHLNMDVSSAAALKHASSRSGNKYLDYNAYKMAAPVPAMRSARPAHIQLPGEAGNNVTRSLTDMQVEAELIERKVRSTWDEAEFYAMRDGIREFGRSFPIVGEVALFDQSQEVIRHLVETELEAEYEQEKLDKEEKEGGKQQTGSSLTSTVSSSQQLQKSTAALPKDLWRHSGIKATPDLITFYYMHKHELKWKVKPKARPAQKKRKEKVRQMLRIVHV